MKEAYATTIVDIHKGIIREKKLGDLFKLFIWDQLDVVSAEEIEEEFKLASISSDFVATRKGAGVESLCVISGHPVYKITFFSSGDIRCYAEKESGEFIPMHINPFRLFEWLLNNDLIKVTRAVYPDFPTTKTGRWRSVDGVSFPEKPLSPRTHPKDHDGVIFPKELFESEVAFSKAVLEENARRRTAESSKRVPTTSLEVKEYMKIRDSLIRKID